MPTTPAPLLLIFFLAAAALHGCWLAVLIFLKNRNLPLAVALVATSFYLLNYLLFLTGIIRLVPDLLGWLVPSVMLAGAGFYFFIRKMLLPESRWRWLDTLHLIPFAEAWWQIFPILTLTTAEKLAIAEWLLQPGRVFPLRQILLGNLHLVVLLGYAGAAWRLARKNELDSESIENQGKARWARRFSEFFALLLLLDFGLKISLALLHWDASTVEYLLAGLLAVAIHLVGYFALGSLQKFPKILPAPPPAEKYKTSPLDAEKLAAAKTTLLDLMAREQPFLQPDLKIAGLAARLGMPSHHLSQVLSEAVGSNFNDFVNSYRVREVQRRLSDGRFRYLSLEAVGLDCGFSNKTTFNRVFKKLAGCTPSEFFREAEKRENSRS